MECIKEATKNLVFLDINPADIIALGLTNQRETTVLWHRTNGTPLYNAIGKFDVLYLYKKICLYAYNPQHGTTLVPHQQ